MVSVQKVVAAVALIVLEAIAFVLALVAFVRAGNSSEDCQNKPKAFLLFIVGGFVCVSLSFVLMAVGHIYLVLCCERDKFVATPYWLFLRPAILYIPPAILFGWSRYRLAHPSVGDHCFVKNLQNIEVIGMVWFGVVAVLSGVLFGLLMFLGDHRADAHEDIKYQHIDQ